VRSTMVRVCVCALQASEVSTWAANGGWGMALPVVVFVCCSANSTVAARKGLSQELCNLVCLLQPLFCKLPGTQ
jgi:hypothetical protein